MHRTKSEKVQIVTKPHNSLTILNSKQEVTLNSKFVENDQSESKRECYEEGLSPRSKCQLWSDIETHGGERNYEMSVNFYKKALDRNKLTSA